VKNIRRKLERDPHAPRYLETVYGIGYRLVEE
jgi:DNA-binding response OmpR family regulator